MTKNDKAKITHVFRRHDLAKKDPCRTKNLYVDYLGGADALESVPGYRRICSMCKKIHSILRMDSQNGEFLLLHSSDSLYKFSISACDELESLEPIITLADRQSYSYSKSGYAFITDGERLYGFDRYGEPYVLSDDPEIAGCRVMELFKENLYLSGNPSCPEKIFCSTPLSREEKAFYAPLEFEGLGLEVRQMLAMGNQLWIFRSGSDKGDIIIVTYDPADGSYLQNQLLFEIPFDCALAQDDRIIFLSGNKLFTIENLCDPMPRVKRIMEISLTMLSSYDPGSVSLGLWMGYVALMTPGRILLVDNREQPYVIYPIENIGDYKNDHRAYRYSDKSLDGYYTHKDVDSIATGEIFSLIDENGEAIHYELQNDKRYLVYPTDQRIGGDFLPAERYLCQGDRMWFTTENGELFLFNNLMRGKIPPHLKEENPDLSVDQGLLHPYYYSFADHSAEYVLELPEDDFDRPDLKKNSRLCAAMIKCKNLMDFAATAVFYTDGKEAFIKDFQSSQLNFSCLDFSSVTPQDDRFFVANLYKSFYGWRSSKIVIKSNEFAKPMAISNVSRAYDVMENQ